MVAGVTTAYLLIRPAADSSRVVPKAAFGTVTTQQATPRVAMSSKSGVMAGAAQPAVSMPSGPKVSVAPKAGGAPKLVDAAPAGHKPGESKQAELKSVETGPTPSGLAASRPEVQSLAVQSGAESQVVKPAPLVAKPATADTRSVAARPSGSNQAGATTGSWLSNLVSGAARSLVSNQLSVAAGPSVSAQPGAAARSSASNQASATTGPSLSRQPNVPSSPIAASKQGVLPQPVVSKPNEASAAASHGLASAAPPAVAEKRDAKSSADQTSRNVTRNLQMARVMLSKDNLTEARSRLTAVIAAQPRNRDAQSLEATLSVREQQRDAVLQTARNCESSSRWICAWHNAGDAMVIDSGSADAERILSHAMHEAEATKAPAAAPVVEPSHKLPYHH